MEKQFNYQWGGEDTVFTKMRRWADKQNPIVRHLAHGFIEWLWQQWVDGRIELEMTSVDKQAEVIVTQWEEEDKPQIKYEPSEVDGLYIISIGINNNSESSCDVESIYQKEDDGRTSQEVRREEGSSQET